MNRNIKISLDHQAEMLRVAQFFAKTPLKFAMPSYQIDSQGGHYRFAAEGNEDAFHLRFLDDNSIEVVAAPKSPQPQILFGGSLKLAIDNMKADHSS